jgi:adenylate kinase
MKEYFTCDGCSFIFPEEVLNALDSKWVYCVECLVETIKEQVESDEEEEEEEEEEELHPRRPWP